MEMRIQAIITKMRTINQKGKRGIGSIPVVWPCGKYIKPIYLKTYKMYEITHGNQCSFREIITFWYLTCKDSLRVVEIIHMMMFFVLSGYEPVLLEFTRTVCHPGSLLLWLHRHPNPWRHHRREIRRQVALWHRNPGHLSVHVTDATGCSVGILAAGLGSSHWRFGRGRDKFRTFWGGSLKSTKL